jgi:serine/threonine protein kinase
LGKPYLANSDVWSLGLTLFECAIGCYPYFTPEYFIRNYRKHEITYWEIVDKIGRCSSPKLEAEGFSDMFKDFINQCLDKNMETRPSSEKMLVMLYSNLESSFFEEVCRGGCKKEF